jgi:hypothetical protein
MITIATSTWQVEVTLSEIIAAVALLLSVANFAVILWDRRPHLAVGLENDLMTDYDEETGFEYRVGHRLWIDIVNRSSRRIKVSHFILEWKKSWLSRRWWKVDADKLPDLQPGDMQMTVTTRFWIEPWGDAVFSLDSEELMPRLGKGVDRESVWMRVSARDVLGRWFKSNKVRLKV